MSDKTLVIMAAGMGSRYGGMKQIDPVGPCGDIIIGYSIYDAIRAGFNKVVFIIKKEHEADFREIIGDKVAKKIRVEYVFQEMNHLPAGFTAPEGRVKPWGTGHAIFSCLGVVNEPFLVINADDFYGRNCYETASRWIDRTVFDGKPYKFSMAGFYLKNTLTENGTVSRGVCEVDENSMLLDVVERTKIMRRESGIAYTDDDENWVALPENVHASMNCWCFPPTFLSSIEKYFTEFLHDGAGDPLKKEFYLPFVVRDMLKDGSCTVEVLPTSDRWFGVTYIQDKPGVQKAVRELIAQGVYPEKLW